MDGTHQSIQCEGPCDSWLHRRCAGLSKTAFAIASKSTEAFHCPLCRLSYQEKEIATLKEALLTLEKKKDLCH